MTDAESYLRAVASAMWGMDRRVREDVLRELRAHLADAVADGGESSAFESLEPPRAIAKRYKELYGYGVPFQALFVLAAMGLALFTVPVFGLVEPAASLGSLVALGVLVLFLLLAAMDAGSRVGLISGLAAGLMRIAVLVAAQFVAEVAPVTDASGWTLFLAVSVLLVVLGYLPGRAKERWTKPDVSM